MLGMDCVNQQARERDCKLTKRSQAERLAIADSLIASVWEEYLNSSIDRDNLQVAAYIQANANRIVWKLNALNNPNTPNTLKALDCIRRQEAIDLIEDIETKRLKGEIGLMYAHAIRGLKALPSEQPEIVQCKDCKWWDRYNDYKGYCMAAQSCTCTSHWDIQIRRTYDGDFYCAHAEPKEEYEEGEDE